MKPSVLLVDEPSIGLEPRYIDMVFEILKDLQHNEKKTIILVEQNAKKGLEFADYRLRFSFRPNSYCWKR
jgi:branched-chain amino acid transport system ATP-binding protein